MYLNYLRDRQDLNFGCLKDLEDGKQATLIVKTGVIYIPFSINLFVNSRFISDLELTNHSYSDKPYQERVVSSNLNQKLKILEDYHNRGLNVQTRNVKDYISSKHLINGLRGGSDNLPEITDQNLEKINTTLKESVLSDKLRKNITSKSLKGSKSFTNESVNKIISGIIDKLAPVIGNPKFLRILTETQKPAKSEFSILVESSSKDISDPKPQKIPAKKSSSIFAEALVPLIVPLNPYRWAAFTAGSFMASDMPDVRDKLLTPLDNLRVTKEYLETAQSDTQWRDRFWKVAEDTTAINIASEMDGIDGTVVGAFGAGAASNKIADSYMDEMVVTEVTKNEQEKLNFEIFKQTAREKDLDVSKVRGTGLMREFVPDFMQEDICERPERNSRPNSWEDTSSPYDDELSFN